MLVASVFVGFAGSALADGISVSPVRIHLEPANPRGTVTVKTSGARMIPMEVRGFRWVQEHGEDKLIGDTGFIAAPPVFDLPAEGEQVLRVGLKSKSADPVEQTYRIMVTELPDATLEASGVKMLMRMSLPVFVTPKGAVPKPILSAVRHSDGTVKVTLKNEGTAHIQLTGLSVVASGTENSAAERKLLDYVLAASEKSWVVTPETSLPGGTLNIVAETNIGALESPLASGN